jgi:hypothetical protein
LNTHYGHKKNELYSSLRASCDESRGGMDASQHKDYVLLMLFIKYISDKYADSDDFATSVNIPKGASFNDMLQLRCEVGKENKEIMSFRGKCSVKADNTIQFIHASPLHSPLLRPAFCVISWTEVPL